MNGSTSRSGMFSADALAGCERPFSQLPSRLPAPKPAKARVKNSAAGGHPEVDTPRLLEQQRTGAGLNRLDCSYSKSLTRIAPINPATGEADAPASQRERRNWCDYASTTQRNRATSQPVRLRPVVDFNHHHAGHCIKRKQSLKLARPCRAESQHHR